ncbi:MAG TPA: hypothetical protein LFW21_03725 [Rickettsia endosymbiont of Pyrocoelia pectoralis]|nr:hypothetical protein [Rickettsia endosymbiont of Pyrocoelia pectoralis]
MTDANRHPEFNSNDVKEAQSIFKQSGSNSESFVDEFLEKKYQEANKENSNLKKYEINTCTKQL